MLAKHSRQWPIIEGLISGLRVVYKIHRLIECYTPYGPINLHQGVSSTVFPPTEYYMYCIPGHSSWRASWWKGEQEAESALEEFK